MVMILIRVLYCGDKKRVKIGSNNMGKYLLFDYFCVRLEKEMWKCEICSKEE
jgi:hypothetical protein